MQRLGCPFCMSGGRAGHLKKGAPAEAEAEAEAKDETKAEAEVGSGAAA